MDNKPTCLAGTLGFLSRLVTSLTLEPALLILSIGANVELASGLPSKLLLDKVCLYTYGHPPEICANLTSSPDIQTQVQLRVNYINLLNLVFKAIPIFILSFYVGTLADRMGMKPFILMSLIGSIWSSIWSLVFYAFLETIPVEMILLHNIQSLFGEKMTYYTANYGFMSKISSNEDRPYRLVRMDGYELVGVIIGTLLSPYVFENLGFYGCYIFHAATNIVAFIYILIWIKEPKIRPSKPLNCGREWINSFKYGSAVLSKLPKSIGNLINYTISPVVAMITAIFRKRKNNIRFYLGVQFFIMMCHYMGSGDDSNTYLYMSLVYGSDFSPRVYSYFNLMGNCTGAVGTLIVMPFMANILKFHETSMGAIIQLLNTTGLVLAAFSPSLFPWYFLSYALVFMRISQYSTTRALISKTVKQSELGKVFSGLGVMASSSLVLFGPLNKKLYADTLETFPAAQTLLAASVCALAGLVNLALSTKKDLLRKNAVEVKIEQDNEDREEAEETEEVREANGQQHQDQQLEDVGTPKY